MKKLLIIIGILSATTTATLAAVLPADKTALQQLTATNVNQMLQERDGHLLPIAPISASRNYLTNTCNIGSPTYEWRYVYAKKFYRDGVELTGGGAGSGDTVAPSTHSANYVPQWNGTPDSKTLVEGFPITAQGKVWVNLSTTANMRNNLGLDNHQLITASTGGISVSGTVTANTLAGSLGASNLTGTVASARLSGAYTGITGTGTLANLNVTGTVTANAFSGTLPATNLSGTINTARLSGAYTGITSVGTLGDLNVTGTVTANALSGTLPATNLSGTVASARISGAYTGITGVGTLTALNVNGTATANIGYFSNRVKTSTIQCPTSAGITFLCSNGDTIAQFDGGGSLQITSPIMVATVNVLTPVVKARTSAGLSLEDDAGIVGLKVNDGGKILINSTGTQGQLNVSGDVRVTGNIYVSGNKVPVTRTIAFGIDGGTSVPSTGNLNATYIVPVNQTLTNWYISSDATGNAVLDIKRNGSSIIGGSGNKPTLTSAISNNAAAANWTSTTLTAGDRLVFVLDSIATAKAVTVILKTKEQ